MARKKSSRPIPFTTSSARQREAQSFVDVLRQAHHAMDALDDLWIIDDTWYAKLGRQLRRALRDLLWELWPVLQLTLILFVNLLVFGGLIFLLSLRGSS